MADILHTTSTGDPSVPHVAPVHEPGASAPSPLKGSPVARWGMRLVAVAYLLFLLILPVCLLVVRTFEKGFETFWEGLTNEEAVHALGGHKSLYSTVHYSEDEFWHRYNGTAYHAIKATYDPDGRLPDLYHKVSR